MSRSIRFSASANGLRNFLTVDLVNPAGAFTPAAVGDGSTDDAPAFRAFNTWAQAQNRPIALTLGTGSKTFLLNSSDSAHSGARRNSLVYGLTKPLQVIGNGPSTSIIKGGTQGVVLGTSSFKSGTGFYGSSTDWTARLNSVSAGATQVTCKTLADALLFSTSTWALLAGIDMQGSGFPPNPFYFEYVYITGIDTGTGVITFQSPITNSYLDTWPVFSTGTPGLFADQGGPATLYALDPTFDIDVTYKDLGTDNSVPDGQTYAGGRQVTFNNVKCHDSRGITPSGNKLITFTGCDLTSYQMESDKLCEKIVFDNTATGQIFTQSAQNIVEIKNGSNISVLNGTPRVITITGSTVGNTGVGPTGFGRCDSFTTSGSTFTGNFTDSAVSDQGDNTGAGIQTDYTISAGVIRIPKSGLDYGCRWMIPNTICYFSNGTSFGPTFRVSSVYDDATYVYVATDWSGSFPSWATRIKVISSLNINFASDTTSSSVDIINAKAATAAGKYFAQTYTTRQFNGSNLGFTGTGNDVGIYPVSGRVVSITVNVSTAYTGSQGTLRWHLGGQFDNQTVYKSDLTTTAYGPLIDLKTAGTRVITPSGVTGTAGSDSGLTLPDSGTWLTKYFQNGICATANIVSEYNGNNGVGPVVTLTAITDQGY